MRWFSVYLRATDELIACGTARECAHMMGMSLQVFRSTVCKVRTGINKRYEIFSEEVVGDD